MDINPAVANLALTILENVRATPSLPVNYKCTEMSFANTGVLYSNSNNIEEISYKELQNKSPRILLDLVLAKMNP